MFRIGLKKLVLGIYIGLGIGFVFINLLNIEYKEEYLEEFYLSNVIN